MKTGDSNKSAAVLVFAVLLLAAGVFVLAGIAQLSATQALIGQSEWEALNRRMMLENSRAMARQFMLSKMFNSVLTNTSGYRFTNELGGFVVWPPTVDLSSGGDYWTTRSFSTEGSTNGTLQVNPFTLMERGGFYRVVIAGRLQEKPQEDAETTNWIEWKFQVRTRSPTAAGYPVVRHLDPRTNVLPVLNNDDIASLAGVSPYVDMYEAEQFVGFHDMARMKVSSVTNTDLDPTGYEGYLDVPDRIAQAGVFTNVDLQPVNAPVTATIDLTNRGGQESVMRCLLDPANGIDPSVTTLVLRGVGPSSTELFGMPPLQVVVASTMTNLKTLVLEQNNPLLTGRPVYISFQRNLQPEPWDQLDVRTNGASGVWRLGLTAQHSDVVFNTGGMDIVGGVRTDGYIFGSPSLKSDLDPGGLDSVADRMMWLEDYKLPK